jgi:endonuclease/exonuclease/phosphatase (EEP) superfamily protein YafD
MIVTTFNILADAFIESDKNFLNKWYPTINKHDLKMENRFNTLIKYINGDIILLQEVTPLIRNKIYDMFNLKYIILPLSIHKSKTEITGNLTLIKKNIFTNIVHNTIYINDKAVSITSVDNIDIYNIHLDDTFRKNRLKELKLIKSTFNINKKIIIGGDFNGNEKLLHLLLKDFKLNIEKKGTYLCESPMIDYIYAYGFKNVKGFVDNIINKNTCYYNTIKKYGSDHYPVYSKIS